MTFDFWTILLIVSASQCVFLLTFFLTCSSPNRDARNILIILLSVVLAINLSNIISSSYLYRLYPAYMGFARGMVLLLGPLLYLYMVALIKSDFQLRRLHLLHFLPYLIGLVFIKIQENGVPEEIMIATVDAMMEGRIKMNLVANLWFISYFIHLLVYLGLSYTLVRNSIHSDRTHYLISVESRVRWLKSILLQFVIITLLFLGIFTYCLYTGVYTIVGNFLYTLILAVIVYLIAYQAIRDRSVLAPDFTSRYRNLKPTKEKDKLLLDRLLNLLEVEKVFTNPDLEVSTLAKMLDCPPHVLSQLINTKFGQNFNGLLQAYRIKEFKVRIEKGAYRNYSIMGIAYDVGYNSKSTFNTHFKKQTGLTPSQYLKGVIPESK